MIRYNVPYWRARQAELAWGAPIVGEPATRWSGQRAAPRPSPISLGAATLLHLAAAWLLLSYARVTAIPAASDDQMVALVFTAAPPHAVPPPVPTVAAVTPTLPPEPPPPPDAPVLAAIPPTPPDA